jgi:hypothetical protein
MMLAFVVVVEGGVTEGDYQEISFQLAGRSHSSE